MSIEALVDEGIGNSAYLVSVGESRELAVDASMDLRSVREAADLRGLRVAFAADAHLGGLRLRALATPGHTDEHVAFLLLDGDAPLGVFTGGSLIVGAAPRTDLVSPERTEELARAPYHSLQRLLTLPDGVAVWPTHGAGSFCSAPPGAERTRTIGRSAWRAHDLPTASAALATAAAVSDDQMLDIRQASEFTGGHVPGAGHGERAMTAASVLERAGRDHVAVLLGGPQDWATTPGASLEAGA